MVSRAVYGRREWNAVTASPISTVEQWFAAQRWEPFAFQEEIWRAYLAGESGLVHAATGTGKTYAAWSGHCSSGCATTLPPPARPARTTRPTATRALDYPIAGAGGGRRGRAAGAGRRAGTALVDRPAPGTRAASRAAAAAAADGAGDDAGELVAVAHAGRRAGDVRAPGARRRGRVARAHEPSKRGVQTELALARLRRWRPGLRTWGLSATLGNLDVARETLLGLEADGRPRSGPHHPRGRAEGARSGRVDPDDDRAVPLVGANRPSDAAAR